MARGVNKVILIGNLGKDPEVKYLASGSAVTNVSIATTESWKDKTTGEQVDRTEWHNIVFYSRLAEIVGEYLKKGSQIYVEGRLTTRKWQDKEGQDRYTTEIIASEMQMLGGRGGGMGGAEGYDAPAPSRAAPSRAPRAASGGASAPPRSAADDFEDDIPF